MIRLKITKFAYGKKKDIERVDSVHDLYRHDDSECYETYFEELYECRESFVYCLNDYNRIILARRRLNLQIFSNSITISADIYFKYDDRDDLSRKILLLLERLFCKCAIDVNVENHACNITFSFPDYGAYGQLIKPNAISVIILLLRSKDNLFKGNHVTIKEFLERAIRAFPKNSTNLYSIIYMYHDFVSISNTYLYEINKDIKSGPANYIVSPIIYPFDCRLLLIIKRFYNYFKDLLLPANANFCIELEEYLALEKYLTTYQKCNVTSTIQEMIDDRIKQTTEEILF